MSLGMMVNLGTAMSLRATINLRMVVVEHYDTGNHHYQALENVCCGIEG